MEGEGGREERKEGGREGGRGGGREGGLGRLSRRQQVEILKSTLRFDFYRNKKKY
jgi:hypothetical protein